MDDLLISDANEEQKTSFLFLLLEANKSACSGMAIMIFL